MNILKRVLNKILNIMRGFRKAIYRVANINYDPTWTPSGAYCITQEVVPEDPSLTELTIGSSDPTIGGGMLDFLGGEPNEILQLSIEVTTYGNNFSSLDFDAPLTAISISSANLIEGGSITLDSNGRARVPYHYTGINTAFSCTIKITGRSSLKPIPETDRTIISNS